MLPSLSLLALLAQPPASPVEVIVSRRSDQRPFVDQVTCALTNPNEPAAARRVRRVDPGRWEWTCRAGDRLGCDAPGSEPLDLTDAACQARRAALHFLPARVLRLTTPDTRPLTVEWRREAGAHTTLLATREVSSATSLSLPVATEERVVRVRWLGGSPLSLIVPAGHEETVQPLPSPVPGGELFGRLAARSVMPERLSIDVAGRPIELTPSADRHFSRSGLQPGVYRLIPTYRGGISGPAFSVVVAAGDTIELLPPQIDETGGVVLTADAEVCGNLAQSRLLVRRIEGERSHSYYQVLEDNRPDGSCRWHIEGLSAGRYDAGLFDERERLNAHVDFEVADEAVGSIRFAPPAVMLSGRVTAGGRSVSAGTLLVFQRPNQLNQEWRTETDSHGAYEIALDKAGRFGLDVRTRPYLPTASRVVNVEPGSHRFDIDLPDGALRVAVRRADGAPFQENVQVHVRSGSDSWDGFVTPKDGAEFEFFGLRLGGYQISGDTPSGLVSQQTALVTLTPTTPSENVELVLDDLRGALELRGPGSESISGATVNASGTLLRETAPGSFELTRIAPGTPLYLSAPGYVPSCPTLQPTDFPLLSILLLKGAETAAIRLSPPVQQPVGVISGLPGADCPVPLSLFPVTVQTDERSSILSVRDLPIGVFQYRPGVTFPFKALSVPGPEVSFTVPVRPDAKLPDMRD